MSCRFWKIRQLWAIWKFVYELYLKWFSSISDSFPGLWEVPLVDYTSKDGRLCNFIDSCTPPDTAQEAFELFNSNFERHYTTNRAPFFMLLEEEWLANNTFFEGKVTWKLEI